MACFPIALGCSWLTVLLCLWVLDLSRLSKVVNFPAQSRMRQSWLVTKMQNFCSSWLILFINIGHLKSAVSDQLHNFLIMCIFCHGLVFIYFIFNWVLSCFLLFDFWHCLEFKIEFLIFFSLLLLTFFSKTEISNDSIF